jgi:hypothetical protein
MKFVIDDNIVGGTCLQGYLNMPFSRLVAVLGEPGEGDGYKVAFEWQLRFDDGTVATIYDYKVSSLYDDESAPTPETMRTNEFSDWHVGGNSKRALELVTELFAERKRHWAEYANGPRMSIS